MRCLFLCGRGSQRKKKVKILVTEKEEKIVRCIRATEAVHSRRFLRELDKAPRGNNLHYIYYSVLTFLHRVTRV